MFKKLKFMVTFFLLGFIPLSFAFQSWERGPENAGLKITAALPHPVDADKTLLAVSNQIFEAPLEKTFPATEWKKISRLPEAGSVIVRLFFFMRAPENLFAMTSNTIFTRTWENPEWQNIFTAFRPSEKLSAFAVSGENAAHYFSGTNLGLMESKDAGKSWHPVSSMGRHAVCSLSSWNENLWTATSEGVFVSNGRGSFSKVLDAANTDEFESETETTSLEEESSETPCPFFEVLTSSSKVWVMTSRRILESQNQGKTWQPLPDAGLRTASLQHMAHSAPRGRLVVASDREIFEYQKNKHRWEKISGDWEGSPLLDIFVPEGKSELLILSTAGTFYHPFIPDEVISPSISIPDPQRQEAFETLMSFEPSAVEIQNAVSRFANTRFSKIKRWHAESRFQALFPTVSFKKDFSLNNNIDIDRRGTNDPDAFIEGPADTSRGWDFSVSWDLGDFIFSSSQTSIDSREKIMVEMRHDLLQEATRLYYERRRLQMEAFLTPEEDESLRVEQQLHIEELTALLDGMTGGFLSKRLRP